MQRTTTLRETLHPIQFRVMCDTFDLPVRYTSVGNILVKPLKRKHVIAVFGVINMQREVGAYTLSLVQPESEARLLRPRFSLLAKRTLNEDGSLCTEWYELCVKVSWTASKTIIDAEAEERAAKTKRILAKFRRITEQEASCSQ